jgi:hypothetical protein
MPIVELVPESRVEESGSFTVVSAANSAVALSDGSNSTYVRAGGSTTTDGWYCRFLMTALSIPAGSIVEKVQLAFLYSHAVFSPPNSEILRAYTVLVGRPSGGGHDYFGYTSGEVTPSWENNSATIHTWYSGFKETYQTSSGAKYIGDVATGTGVRFYVDCNTKRGYPWSIARMYQLILRVHYNSPPVATVTAPTGTVLVSRPPVSWTHVDSDGDPQTGYDLRIFSQAQYSAPSFNVETTTPAYKRIGSGTGETTHTPTKAPGPNGNYRAYVRTQQRKIAGDALYSAWDSEDFTTNADTPPAPAISATYDSGAAAIVVQVNGRANLLTGAQSSFETAPTPTPTAGTNTTLLRVQTTGTPPNGTWAYQITKTVSTGTASMVVNPTSGSVYGAPVTAGASYDARASFRAAVTGRQCTVAITWLTAAGSSISTSTSTAITDTTGGWTEAQITATAPATSAFAQITAAIASAATSEVHRVDKVSLSPTGAGAWSLGGFASTAHVVTIQRSFNAGTTWTDVPAARVTQDPLNQAAELYDWEVPSGATVHYRANAESTDPNGDPATSPWSSTDDATNAVLSSWMLRDLEDPDQLSMPLVMLDGYKLNSQIPGTTDYPLGSSSAVVVHDGRKDPVLSGDILLRDQAAVTLWRSIVGSGNTLLLQDVRGEQWYVQVGDYDEVPTNAAPLATETTPVSWSTFVRGVTFVSVARPGG